MEQFGHKYEGQDPAHIDNISFAEFDHKAFFFLELREKYGTTTEASCFVSEKV